MRWGFLIGLMIFLFVLEGTVLQVFSFNAREGSFVVLPRFVLIQLIFISLYLGRKRAFILGLIFGVMFDVQYSDVIGVYAFSLAMIPYLSALAYQYFQLNSILIILTVFISVFVHETVNFYLFELFALTKTPYDWMIHLPTSLFNAGIAILAYRPLDRLLEQMSDGRQEEKHF